MLGVPAGFIQPKSSLAPEIRLGVPYSQTMKADVFRTHHPFCTWEELKEIQESGLVEIASHSMTHSNLLKEGVDLISEVEGSKKLLEKMLKIKVQTFIYPLGKFNRPLHTYVKKHYEFAMRIGAALNFGWQNHSGIIYRVLSDNLTSIEEPFKKTRYLSYAWFYLVNSLRKR